MFMSHYATEVCKCPYIDHSQDTENGNCFTKQIELITILAYFLCILSNRLYDILIPNALFDVVFKYAKLCDISDKRDFRKANDE